MDYDVGNWLFHLGMLLIAVLTWTYYIRCVRMNPRSEEWYDEDCDHSQPVGWAPSNRDLALYLFPYSTMLGGAVSVGWLISHLNLPRFIEMIYLGPLTAAVVIGCIGTLATFGIPLPWPFVPRWVVEIRKTKRARARQRREAKRANKNK